MSESLNFLDPSVLSGLNNLELQHVSLLKDFSQDYIKALNEGLVLSSTIIAIINAGMIYVM